MTEDELQLLRYPIGKFIPPSDVTPAQKLMWIGDLKHFPTALSEITENLSAEQLTWRYRPKGWTIQQVVHHCADSHINAFTRFKLALTETTPTIKPYQEERWAEQPDVFETPISDSISILSGVHSRLVTLLNSLTYEEMNRTLIHPDHKAIGVVKNYIGMYAWHSNHHLAHVKQAIVFAGKY